MGVRLMVDRGTDGLGEDIFAILKRGAPLAAVSLIETSTLAPRGDDPLSSSSIPNHTSRPEAFAFLAWNSPQTIHSRFATLFPRFRGTLPGVRKSSMTRQALRHAQD
ncbi:hypothetical protein [Aurantimonas coralicida]|uniref:hypothetical protein n=1 Tax=Aurantimonas coralicida TaxID=182270 RepID=UPI001D193607|nr:hypothetical protein [Aurantimonas coralicida]MCC4296904.1 hypothetical protein [Aurantimonas coralicida]